MNPTGSAFRSARPSHKPFIPPDDSNIYSASESSHSQDERAIPDSDSSFEIQEDENSALDKNKENMEKLLDRLGLKSTDKAGSKSQELEAVVSNFVENCIGSVDREANTAEYDRKYNDLYQDKVKALESPNSSIFISELTQLEKIHKVSQSGVWGLYRKGRLLLKYFSLGCEKVVVHPLFEGFILTIILLNSIKMATDDPLATQTSLPQIESAFTGIYVIQMMLKIFAWGFLFNKGAYLRDMWNIMDFVIVVTSLLPLIINFGFSVNALRAIRVLRPLRTITKIRALKMIIRTLFYSFSLVVDSIYILLFVMFVFAIAGMQLFGGKLKYNCMDVSNGALTDTLCGADSDCSLGQICAKSLESPNFSIINFDTLLWSFLSVFQVITMEGWSNIMQYIQKTSGMVYGVYALLIVLICEFVLLNMTMAILKYKYSQVKGNAIEEEEEEKDQYQPQFLKKIGIYSNISALHQPSPFARTNEAHRKRVGCAMSFPPPSDNQPIRLQDLVSFVDAPRPSQIIQDPVEKGLDLEELKQLGKLPEHKWEVNNLQFETNQLSDRDKEREKVDKSFSQKDDEEGQQDDEDSFSDGEISELSEEEEAYNDSEQNDSILSSTSKFKVPEHMQEIHGRSQVRKATQKNQQPIKSSGLPTTSLIRKTKASRQLSELDYLLALIGTKPGVTRNKEHELELPDIDVNRIEPQKIYERFADLGDYGIRKAARRVELAGMAAATASKKRSGKVEDKGPKIAPIQEVFEENALDIKELHLKNELEKTELRFRVKSDDLIDQERNYDFSRVLASLKIKEAEKKKEEIRENMNSIHFQVRMKMPREEKNKENARATLYSRNLENSKAILKIPQLYTEEAKEDKKIEDEEEAPSRGGKGGTHYLKMLQNHQMGEKVEMKLDRIMAVFFKKEGRKEEEEKRASPEQEYDQLRQDDILKRHGHLELQYPCSKPQEGSEEILKALNMRKEEYEIHIRGLTGLFTVIRKKTLLFASHPAYDNFVLVLVILNTVTMAMSGFVNIDASPYTYIMQVFTIAFTIDVAIKIFAYGMGFFGDAMNLFDTGVVAVSLVELSMGTTSNLSALRSIRILRAFRVLRITRLIRSLAYMRIIMGVVSSIINEFVYVFLLLFLFIFIYTLLGMQIFGGNFPKESVTGIRQNFDNFFSALFSIFQVMTVQNWDDLGTMAAKSSLGPSSILFFISWIFLGNWILLNLLQAILLDGFDDDATEPDYELADAQESAETELAEEEMTEGKQKEDESDDGLNESRDDIEFEASDASLFLFQPDNPIRKFALMVTSSSVFAGVIFVAIICSSAKLALDTYLDEDSGGALVQGSNIADYVFNVLFIIEAALKIIGTGLVVGEAAYLKNSWNKLDFIIVCTSILDMVLLNVNLSIIKLLRTLRPLRIITRNEDMRIMVSSLVESLIGIFNVLIICLCVFLMFAILGMNLLQGKLFYCNETGSEIITGNYGPFGVNADQCQAQGGVWTLHLINFENIANSMLSLYIFSTRQNWPFYTYTFIDSGEEGPTKDNSQILYFIFVVLFIFIGSLFFMDLLVGVMFMNYHQAQRKIRPRTLSDKQINWQNLQKMIVDSDPCFSLYLQPESPVRKFLWQIVSTKLFEIGVALVIIVNIMAMALSDDDITHSFEGSLTTLNSVCSFIFIAELALKLIVYKHYYFLSGWNVFDFFVVLASILDLILQYTGVSSGGSTAISILPQIARIFRVLRITRLLRMFKSFKGLQKLIETFVFSLPAISKGLSILFLYLFISAVLASTLMGKIGRDFGGTMSNIVNYHNFHQAFETLFINLTGQNWYYFMFYSTKQGYVECTDGTTSSCVSPLNFIFWLPFEFLGQKVFLELFVLIVLDQFEANYINEHNPMGTFALFEEDFRDNWIDTTAKYHSTKIEAKRLIDLMLLLRPPLGLARASTLSKYEDELRENEKMGEEEIREKVNEMDRKLKKSAARLLHKMNVMRNRLYFGYHETFYYFAKIAIVPQFIEDATPDQKEQLDNMHKEAEEALEKLRPAGNLFYYDELEEDNANQEPLNPISLILFTQMIMKSWHNYSLKSKHSKNGQKNNRQQEFDSLNNSCLSDIEEAKYEKLTGDKKGLTRRGGFIENSIGPGHQAGQFKATPDLASIYGEGKKAHFNERNSNNEKKSVRNSRRSGSRNLRGSIQKFSKKVSAMEHIKDSRT